MTVAREPGGIPAQSCCLVAGVFPDGSILVEPPEFLPNTPGGPRHGRLTLLRLSPDGTRVDTVGRFDSRRLTYDANARNGIRPYHFSAPFSYAIVGDRVYGGNGEDGSLTVVDATGRRQPGVVPPLRRSQVTRAIRAAFEDTIRAQLARNPRAYEARSSRSWPVRSRIPFQPSSACSLTRRGISGLLLRPCQERNSRASTTWYRLQVSTLRACASRTEPSPSSSEGMRSSLCEPTSSALSMCACTRSGSSAMSRRVQPAAWPSC